MSERSRGLKFFRRVGLILFGVFVVIACEFILQVLSPPAPACREDPFVGFAGEEPLFIRKENKGKDSYVINHRRAKFFNPATFPADKQADSYRVFVLGGSVVMGFPFHEPGSFSRFLAIGLRSLDKSRHYEVINLGGFGYASYRVVRILREIINYDPDLVIVMTGHNEFLEKRTYGEIKDQSPWLVSLKTRLAGLRTYCLLKTAVFEIRGPDSRPLMESDVTWEKYVRDPVQMDLSMKHYRYNLEEMSRICRAAGVPVMFLTLPCNLRDFPPYHSEHGRVLSKTEAANWDDAYFEGLQYLGRGGLDKALGYFYIADNIDPDYAELQYRMGRIFYEKREWANARERFQNAVRLDAWPMRVFQEMNNMILEQDISDSVITADIEKVFSESSPGGITGDDWFLDHCHPDIQGHVLIAREIIATMSKHSLLNAPSNWQDLYEKTAQTYISRLPDRWLAAAYYRAAVETGMNVKRPKRALKIAARADKLAPGDPKISELIQTLTELKNSTPSSQE